jgi:hypothetical protein
MSTRIATRDTGAISAIDKGDITVSLFKSTVEAAGQGSQVVQDQITIPGGDPIGIAKNFSFNVSKPKTPLYVIGQRRAAGFSRDPEDFTFSMGELATFERLEHISVFTESPNPFVIQIVLGDQTGEDGRLLSTSKIKILRLEGVEFDTASFSVEANGSEYMYDFTGRFTRGYISGDLNPQINFDPATDEIVTPDMISF